MNITFIKMSPTSKQSESGGNIFVSVGVQAPTDMQRSCNKGLPAHCFTMRVSNTAISSVDYEYPI